MDILARILAFVFRHKWWLAAAYVTMLGATAGYLVLPWLIGTAVDRIVVGFEDDAVSRGAILSITIMILVTGAFRGAMAFGQAYLGELLSQKVVYDMRSMFYDHLQHMSFGFHDRHHTGNLISRAITDVEAVRMFVQMGLVRTPFFCSSWSRRLFCGWTGGWGCWESASCRLSPSLRLSSDSSSGPYGGTYRRSWQT